jgi:transposase
MGTIGTTKQVEQRRKRGLKLLAQGRSPAEVARQVGVSERTVRRWRQEKRECRKRQTGRRGRPSRLTTEQLATLQEALDKGAYAHGYAEDYWTLDRIGHVIWTLFGVRYHPSGVWHVMHRLGWSSQQPQRQALQRDDKQIVRWKRQVWPRIKKVARPASHAGV